MGDKGVISVRGDISISPDGNHLSKVIQSLGTLMSSSPAGTELTTREHITIGPPTRGAQPLRQCCRRERSKAQMSSHRQHGRLVKCAAVLPRLCSARLQF